MTHLIKTVEAVYDKGYLRPLEPIEQRSGLIYIVNAVDITAVSLQKSTIKNLRGKYRGHLDTTEAFAKSKQREKELEL